MLWKQRLLLIHLSLRILCGGYIFIAMTSAQIWADYSQNVLQYFLAKTRNEHDAQDLRQEVFLKVHAHLGTIREEEKVQHWLSVISRNALMDYWKREKRSFDEHELRAQLENDRLLDHAAEQCVNHMIDTLPGQYGAPLRLSDIEGEKQADVANKLNLSVSGAKSRIQRARRLLKEAITTCCHIDLNSRNELVDADCHNPACGCAT